MTEGWQSVRLDEVEPIAVAGVHWRPLRRMLGVEAFGINAYVAPNAGDDVVEEHTEERLGHEEVYAVLAGHATFTLDGEELDAPAGTVVFVRDPAIRRHARAQAPHTTVLAIGGKAGAPYTPSGWEWYFYAERFRPSQNWEAAIAELEDGLTRYPDHPTMLFSLACYEALAGRDEDALEHLSRAVELEPRLRADAATDEDLESIRGLPGFPPSS